MAPTQGAIAVDFASSAEPSSAARASAGGQQRHLSWEEDPYAVDSEATLHLVDLYFTHVNSATYCLWPRRSFRRWVEESAAKCQLERMVLYAMLAMGSIFADNSFAGFGKTCGAIASEALATRTGRFNLAIVHTRLILALYTFAKGHYGAAWDHSGLALRASTSTYLRLNTNGGCEDSAESQSHANVEYWLNLPQLAECKRRTFWSCFLMDRFCRGTHCVIGPPDVFLQLPCTEEVYERGGTSDAPYYNNGIIDPAKTILTPSSPVSPMAWLVLVTAIWGDVLNFNYRAVFRPAASYRDIYETFYADIYNAMQGWSSRLPLHLQYSRANLDTSIREGYAGTFVSMHTLHHFTLMKLNRYVRHSIMMDLIPRNIRAAHFHGNSVLSILTDLRGARREFVDAGSGQPSQFVLSTSFPGYAAMSAIDVIGAGGLDSNLATTLDFIEGGVRCLSELSQFWTSAKDQLKDSEKRFYQIQAIVSRPIKARGGAWLGRNWGVRLSALDKEVGNDDDCIYGIADDDSYSKIYFDALKEDAHTRRDAPGGLRIV